LGSSTVFPAGPGDGNTASSPLPGAAFNDQLLPWFQRLFPSALVQLSVAARTDAETPMLARTLALIRIQAVFRGNRRFDEVST